jgi:hypothetical protein
MSRELETILENELPGEWLGVEAEIVNNKVYIYIVWNSVYYESIEEECTEAGYEDTVSCVAETIHQMFMDSYYYPRIEILDVNHYRAKAVTDIDYDITLARFTTTIEIEYSKDINTNTITDIAEIAKKIVKALFELV